MKKCIEVSFFRDLLFSVKKLKMQPHFTESRLIVTTSSGELVQRRPQQQPQGSWRLSCQLETKLFLLQLKKREKKIETSPFNPKAAMPKTPTL